MREANLTLVACAGRLGAACPALASLEAHAALASSAGRPFSSSSSRHPANAGSCSGGLPRVHPRRQAGRGSGRPRHDRRPRARRRAAAHGGGVAAGPAPSSSPPPSTATATAAAADAIASAQRLLQRFRGAGRATRGPQQVCAHPAVLAFCRGAVLGSCCPRRLNGLSGWWRFLQARPFPAHAVAGFRAARRPTQVSEIGQVLRRCGCVSPASASGLDTHRNSIN
jgi:hypothetical protein